MTDKIEIELANASDAEILADISKRAFDSDVEVGAEGPGGPEGYDSVDAHRRDALNERVDYWKFTFNGQIVGGTRVYKRSKDHYYIYGVFIDPNFHRRGIGTKTFGLIERKYPDAKMWSLDTPEWNPRTKGFYEKIGFVQTGSLRWVPIFDLRYFVKITDEEYQIEMVNISELGEGMSNVLVEGAVQRVSEVRNITTKDGKEHRVVDVTLVDNTGSIVLVLWDDFIRQVRMGERIIVDTGYVSSFRGNLQLNISRNGQLIITEPN
ncbi:MAG: GNAT family N-acetyltransferase [Candidatus Hodarchaeota archaeon]